MSRDRREEGDQIRYLIPFQNSTCATDIEKEMNTYHRLKQLKALSGGHRK